MAGSTDDIKTVLAQIAQSQSHLLSAFDSLSHRVDELAQSQSRTSNRPQAKTEESFSIVNGSAPPPATNGLVPVVPSLQSPPLMPQDAGTSTPGPTAAPTSPKSGFTSRIVLTTYPKQIGIKPLPMDWGNPDPKLRGPVTVSRAASTIGKRNAIGAHGGSYSIYYALALASKELKADHKPDFTNTQPAVEIGPFPQWGDKKKIVAMDPWGHSVPWTYGDMIKNENVDLRPTIAITKAHMKLPELEESVRAGRLVPDGKVCLNAGGELAVTKVAVEPVWYLPGVAERFGIDEGTLRRSLFEHTGGMYPELITRGDIKVFLPPIGGLTVYIFGDPAKMSDPNSRLALRIHDECNGSDVFGSDICTCRPYLIFGIEEAVKEAQNGGCGVVIYFRKEGRALGEVTKVCGPSPSGMISMSMANWLTVPGVQRSETWRRSCVRLLQAHREHRRRQGYALPGFDARHPSLARHHQNRQDAQHEQVSYLIRLLPTTLDVAQGIEKLTFLVSS